MIHSLSIHHLTHICTPLEEGSTRISISISLWSLLSSLISPEGPDNTLIIIIVVVVIIAVVLTAVIVIAVVVVLRCCKTSQEPKGPKQIKGELVQHFVVVVCVCVCVCVCVHACVHVCVHHHYMHEIPLFHFYAVYWSMCTYIGELFADICVWCTDKIVYLQFWWFVYVSQVLMPKDQLLQFPPNLLMTISHCQRKLFP